MCTLHTGVQRRPAGGIAKNSLADIGSTSFGNLLVDKLSDFGADTSVFDIIDGMNALAGD